MDAIRKIVTIIQDAKSTEKEKSKLVAPIEPKQIEAPKPKEKALPSPKKKNGFDKALDDEIPF